MTSGTRWRARRCYNVICSSPPRTTPSVTAGTPESLFAPPPPQGALAALLVVLLVLHGHLPTQVHLLVHGGGARSAGIHPAQHAAAQEQRGRRRRWPLPCAAAAAGWAPRKVCQRRARRLLPEGAHDAPPPRATSRRARLPHGGAAPILPPPRRPRVLVVHLLRRYAWLRRCHAGCASREPVERWPLSGYRGDHRVSLFSACSGRCRRGGCWVLSRRLLLHPQGAVTVVSTRQTHGQHEPHSRGSAVVLTRWRSAA
jgi:hypothetical protein